MINKIQKHWYPVYLLILVLGAFFVFRVIQRDDVQLDTEEKSVKEVVDEEIVKVDVIVEALNYRKNYTVKVKNTDSVYDVLDEIRQTEAFYYEITDYIYGSEIDHINRIDYRNGEKWVITKSDGNSKPVDITRVFKDTTIEKDCLIEIKLVDIATTQI